jgi:hypothetical protein
MQHFRSDGTPKSTNNAFFIKPKIDDKWLNDIKQSQSGKINGTKRAAKMNSEGVLVFTQNATWEKNPITMDFIERTCHKEGECLVWDGAFDGNNPIINRGDSGRSRVRIRKWIAENILNTPVAFAKVVRMTCTTRGCCAPDHIDIDHLNRTKRK